MNAWIMALFSFALLVISGSAVQMRVETNPVQKVIELLTQLQGQCISEGEEAKRTYDEFVNWCSRTSQEKQHEVRMASAEKDQLAAEIQQAQSIIEQDNSRIQELSGSIATDEADLKAATMLREKEQQDFEDADRELVDCIDTLNRAIGILERQSQQYGSSAAFLQKPTQGMLAFTQAISGLLDAASLLSVDDRSVLNNLIQGQQGGDGGDSDDGLPSAESLLQGQVVQSQPSAHAYSSNTGGIIETLESMQEKAEAAQAEGRRKEAGSKHNFDLLKLSLENKLATENRELDETKQDLALQQEKKATAAGDLEITIKDLANDQAYLSSIQQDCMDRAVTFQSDMTNRKEELAALAQAKKVIQQQTGGAVSHTYGFLQVSATSKSQVASLTPQLREGVRAWQGLTQLAKTTQSVALAQLSNRLASAIRTSAQTGGQNLWNRDPFEKVRSLIKTMIQKLSQEAQEEESQKAFCDREMGHTEEQKHHKEKSIEDLSTKIEKSSADSAKLKEDIATLSLELADLASAQAESARIRQEEHASFVHASGAIKMGLTGIQTALSILRQYYGGGGASMVQVQAGTNLADSMGAAAAASAQAATQDAAPTGAAAGIVGMLEVVESDFSKNLAEVEQEESQNAAEFDKLSQQNKLTKALKENDVKHKKSEAASLDKTASELESDRSQVQDELDAVTEYYEKLKPQCITKPDTYEERKSRREKEVAGLKNALEILEAETH